MESPILDLSAGYEAYLEERRQSGRTDLIKRCGTKMRKLEREVGPMRLEVQVEDPRLLEQTLDWRLARHESRHSREYLLNILSHLHRQQTPHLKGTLSILYASQEIVAAHFGLRSRSTWHWWFPAYNNQFEKYSPGLIMILKMAEAANQAGVTLIDFGRGNQDYKLNLMNRSIGLAAGSVEVAKTLMATRRRLHPAHRRRRGRCRGPEYRRVGLL